MPNNIENNLLEPQNVENNEPSTEKDQKYSPFQVKCIDMGWDPSGKKDAEDWALTGITVRNEKITDLYKVTDNIKELMSKQEKNLYEKARMELQAERNEAIARGDVKQVNELDKRQEELKTRDELTRLNQDFNEKHSDWLKGKSYECLKMQKAVNDADKWIGGNSYEEHFQLLDNYIRGEFPNYFNGGEEPRKSQAVVGSSSPTLKSSAHRREYTFDDLTDDQKHYAKLFEKQKIMTIDQYIKEQVKAGVLK